MELLAVRKYCQQVKRITGEGIARSIKASLWLLVALLISAAVVGCSGAKDNKSSVSSVQGTEVKGLMGPIAELPAAIVSVGQSADVQMAKALAERAGLQIKFLPQVTADELKDFKTLIMVVGGSSKGLGAAGVKVEDEVGRIKAVLARAKEQKIAIIGMHIGGEGRRGEISDKFIHAAMPAANYMIVVKSGNKDGVFTNIAVQNNIPLDIVENISEAAGPLKKAFK